MQRWGVRGLVVAILSIALLPVGIAPSVAATRTLAITTGTPCTAAGTVAGRHVCAKVGTKLRWKLRAQRVIVPRISAGISAALADGERASTLSVTGITTARATSDRPDIRSGYQVHAVYVVPADGADASRDTNGQLAAILDAGNDFLAAGAARRVTIDSTVEGYDITYLRTTRTTAELEKSQSLPTDLLAEMRALAQAGANRKTWMFFLEVNEVRGGNYCGYAPFHVPAAVVALNGLCGAPAHGQASYASLSWVHEWLHTLGVEHSAAGGCDLMAGDGGAACPAGKPVTLDASRTRYLGSQAQGADILSLPVWSAGVTRGTLPCSLIPTGATSVAYCSTGTARLGALQFCWKSLAIPQLQVLVDGTWQPVTSGTGSQKPWGTTAWTCNDAAFSAPTATLTVTAPGWQQYRWVSGQQVLEQFTVLWAI